MKKFIMWLIILSLCLCSSPAFAGNIQDTMGKKAVENIIATYSGVSTAKKFLNINAVTFIDGDTDPSVNTGNIFLTANTGATTIADFDGGIDTQKLSVNFGDANTTIQHGADIIMQGGSDFTGQAGDSISFVNVNGVWREVGRSGAVAGATYKVKISGVDTTANYLSTKLTGSDGIKYTASGAGNETLDIYLDYNANNLKITATELNTIQDITTVSTPSFNQVTLNNAPTNGSHASSKDYVDGLIQGLDWKESVKSQVNFVTSEPAAPGTGDRYINTTTGLSSVTSQSVTANYIYEWNGASWAETVPTDNDAVWDENEDVLYTYNGSAWVKFGTTVTHNNTTGKQGGNDGLGEFYHLDATEYAGNWGAKNIQTLGTLQVGNTTIGSGAAGIDYTLTFDGETNNGLITWMEDEDRFDMACDLGVSGIINGVGGVQVNGTNVLTAEADTLDTVTGRGASTTNDVILGNVGIGANSPLMPLHVSKDRSAYQTFETTVAINSTDGYPGIVFADNGESVWGIRSKDTVDNDFNIWRNNGTGASPDWIQALTIDRTSGNVGIGTGDSPGEKLEVSGNIEVTGTIHDASDKLFASTTKALSFTITKPLDLDEADTLPVWVNRTGKTFTISAIYSNSETNNVDFTLKEVTTYTDFTALTTIEAITIATAGTGVYYNDLTSGIDHTVIENTHLIVFDNNATDDPDYVNVTIVGSLS